MEHTLTVSECTIYRSSPPLIAAVFLCHTRPLKQHLQRSLLLALYWQTICTVSPAPSVHDTGGGDATLGHLFYGILCRTVRCIVAVLGHSAGDVDVNLVLAGDGAGGRNAGAQASERAQEQGPIQWKDLIQWKELACV